MIIIIMIMCVVFIAIFSAILSGFYLFKPTDFISFFLSSFGSLKYLLFLYLFHHLVQIYVFAMLLFSGDGVGVKNCC